MPDFPYQLNTRDLAKQLKLSITTVRARLADPAIAEACRLTRLTVRGHGGKGGTHYLYLSQLHPKEVLAILAPTPKAPKAKASIAELQRRIDALEAQLINAAIDQELSQ